MRSQSRGMICPSSSLHPLLPDDFNDVRDAFSRRGAYPKFKALLARRGAIDRWHAFEAKAKERALRDWCALHSIDIAG